MRRYAYRAGEGCACGEEDAQRCEGTRVVQDRACVQGEVCSDAKVCV